MVRMFTKIFLYLNMFLAVSRDLFVVITNRFDVGRVVLFIITSLSAFVLGIFSMAGFAMIISCLSVVAGLILGVITEGKFYRLDSWDKFNGMSSLY